MATNPNPEFSNERRDGEDSQMAARLREELGTFSRKAQSLIASYRERFKGPPKP